MITLCLSLLLMMFGSETAFSADSTATAIIRGRVHCSREVGFEAFGAFATVLVLGTRIDAPTDERGRFVIRGVPPGTHQIEFRQVGVERQRTMVTVRAGSDTTIDLELCPAWASRDRMIDSLTALGLWPPRLDERLRQGMMRNALVSAQRIVRSEPGQVRYEAKGPLKTCDRPWADSLLAAFQQGDFASPASGDKHMCGGFEPGVRVTFMNADRSADSVTALLCYKCHEFSLRSSEGVFQFAFFGEAKQKLFAFARHFYSDDQALMMKVGR